MSVVENEKKYVSIPESRYEDLLESETRLAIIEDYLRYSEYVDKDILTVIIGMVVAKYNKKIVENNLDNFIKTKSEE